MAYLTVLLKEDLKYSKFSYEKTYFQLIYLHKIVIFYIKTDKKICFSVKFTILTRKTLQEASTSIQNGESTMLEEKPKVKKSPNKKPSKVPYQMTDTFVINKGFKSKLKRFVIKEAKFKTESTNDDGDLNAERKYAIESCLVRVMKSRKVYKYQDLINDTMKLLLKFSPDSRDVRAQIENLIKRDYFERDTDDMNT